MMTAHPSLQPAPILLANGDFYGTLAATRSLGEARIPVYIAGHRVLAASRWSRHAVRALRCPPLSDADRFLDWLVELGRNEPGIVLYPTSDEATYLYALRREELERNFRMYQPCVDTIVHVLDKKRLYETARTVGLRTPDTWFPRSDADVERIAREAPMPLLVKPRTQVLSRTHSKGIVVTRREALAGSYRKFVRESTYGRALLDRVPDAADAMIQAYMPDAGKHIYVLAAFIDREGSLFAARSGMKIFQRPRSLGIGLCFEDAELDPLVVDGARRLAKQTGYYGLFQLEFIKSGDAYLLIDFNPRFYNQLAFDIARGLPLSRIVHAAASGDTDRLIRLVECASNPPKNGRFVFCNKFGLDFMLATQIFAGRMPWGEAKRWREWREQHRGGLVDPAVVTGDPFPALVDAATQVYGSLRHPRAFLRDVVFDGRVG
jgi:D-aspartate ligase